MFDHDGRLTADVQKSKVNATGMTFCYYCAVITVSVAAVAVAAISAAAVSTAPIAVDADKNDAAIDVVAVAYAVGAAAGAADG